MSNALRYKLYFTFFLLYDEITFGECQFRFPFLRNYNLNELLYQSYGRHFASRVLRIRLLTKASSTKIQLRPGFTLSTCVFGVPICYDDACKRQEARKKTCMTVDKVTLWKKDQKVASRAPWMIHPACWRTSLGVRHK